MNVIVYDKQIELWDDGKSTVLKDGFNTHWEAVQYMLNNYSDKKVEGLYE